MRDVPLFDRWIQGSEQHAGSGWFKGEFGPSAHTFYTHRIDILGLRVGVK
ncbi:MAG: hypothetical protein OXI72_19915 [Gemmatimonadota bacterium]|nr:hypothetical protein [Gemmatimonadota bacterium]